MEIEIVRADPAGNITVFVLPPKGNPKGGPLGSPLGGMERADAVKALLADTELNAEQVGFVLPPQNPGGPWRRPWRLEMAGGEFCGNASRSFGLLVAAQSGLSGKHTLTIETSGISGPLPVHIDTEAQSAEAEIPGPLALTEMRLEGRHYAVCEFEGITHIIAENMQADEQIARSLIRKLVEGSPSGRLAAGKAPYSALGVMFYDAQQCFMRPVVWTRELDTLVFESSCGSGSAALGVWAARNADDAELDIDLAQPGGIITVRVVKYGGKVQRLSISGKVTLSEVFRYRY